MGSEFRLELLGVGAWGVVTLLFTRNTTVAAYRSLYLTLAAAKVLNPITIPKPEG